MIALFNFARKISIGLLHFAASSKLLHCTIAAVSQLCWKKMRDMFSIAVRVQYLLSQMKQQSQVHLWEPIYFLLTEDIEGDSESESGDGSKSSRKTCK